MNSFGWAGIPGELLHAIAYDWFYQQKLSLSLVCSEWNEKVCSAAFGNLELLKFGLPCRNDLPWKQTFIAQHIKVPRIIALDISGSMKDDRKNLACTIISNLAIELNSCLTLSGIHCIVFANDCYDEKINNLDMFEKFFRKPKSGLGYGTSLSILFECLKSIDREYQGMDSYIPPHVYILSDFEDDYATLEEFTDSQSHLSIQCINVGKPINKDILRLEEEYEKWGMEEAEQQRAILKQKQEKENELKGVLKKRREKQRLPKNQPVMIGTSQSAKKGNRLRGPGRVRVAAQKRKAENDDVFVHELPFTFKFCNADGVETQLKKRKITIQPTFQLTISEEEILLAQDKTGSNPQ